MADFIGTSGDDDITGTEDADYFDISQGGFDNVSAAGGDDTIFVGAEFSQVIGRYTLNDNIDGGDGFDTLQLAGNYGDLNFKNGTIASIEEISLAGGFSYHLTLLGVAPTGQSVTVDGSAVTADLFLNGTGAGFGSLTEIGGAGNDTLIAAKAEGNLFGGAGNDQIYGHGLPGYSGTLVPRVMDGGSGNDAIYAAGGDTVFGGDGDDFVRYVTGSDAGANVDAGSGDDVVQIAAYIAYVATLLGGAGTDTLIFHDRVFLTATEFSAATSGFEIIDAGSGTIHGDAQDNHFDFSGFVVTGNFAVYGGDGHDVLIGSSADDALLGDAGDDTVYGGAGNDTLANSSETGSDVLVGGAGKDVLYGNGGDTFVYLSLEDSLPGTKHRDIIVHIRPNSDRIDLSAIDADTMQEGDQAFHLAGTAFTGAAGELIAFVDSRGHTIVQGDVNGDAVADLAIQVNSDRPLVDHTFVL